MSAGKEIIQRALDRGVPNDEIVLWTENIKNKAAERGVPQEEINRYFGIRDPTSLEPVVRQFRQIWESKKGPEGSEGEPLSVVEALEAGWQVGNIGHISRGRNPDLFLSEDPTRLNRLAFSAAMLAGDAPSMALGAFLGTAAGGGIFSAATGMGGAFATPAIIRTAYMDKYENGEIESFGEFWEALGPVLLEGFKGYLVGFSTGTVGKTAKVFGPQGQILNTAVPVASEIATMTAVGHALEGEIPTPDDFIDTALIIFGIKGVVAGGSRLRRVYSETGRSPEQVLKDMESDPTIIDDLHSTNIEIPRAYQAAAAAAKRGETEALAREVVEGQEPVAKISEPEAKTGVEETVTPSRPTEEGGPPAGRILDHISVDEGTRRTGVTVHSAYTDVVDRLHPLSQAVNALREGRDLSVAEDAYKLARLNVGVTGKATHFLEYSPFEFETFKRVGRPLKAILEPVKADLDPLREYMVAKRALDLSNREIETGIPRDLAEATVRQHAEKLEPIRKELEEYQLHVLRYLRDSGIFSDTTFDALVEANKDYVPFYRMMEDQRAGVGKGLTTRDPIKEIKGSSRKIMDPMESIIKNTYLYLTLAERNEIGTSYVELIEKSPRGAEFGRKAKAKARPITLDPKEMKEIIKKYSKAKGSEIDERALAAVLEDSFSIFRRGAQAPSRNQIQVFRDGKRELWDVDPEVYEVFQGMDAQGAKLLMKMLSAPTRLLRAGAIFSPEFIARNPFRDQLSALVFSENGYIPVYDWFGGIFEIAKNKVAPSKGVNYQDWLRSGGPMATMTSLDRNYLQKNIRQLINQTKMHEKLWGVVKSPIEILATVSELAEHGTRVGEFKRGAGKKEGRTKEQIRAAGFASREVTLDFGRIGARTQNVNRLVAFFNAQVQGTDKMARTLSNPKTRNMALAKIIGTITIPSVVNYLLNRGEEGFDELNDWEKDLFWVYPVKGPDGHNRWQKIPKPFELGLIFGTGAERLVEFLIDQDPDAFKGFLQTLFEGATPSFLPTAAIPPAEMFFNHRFFTNRPLVPFPQSEGLPQYQYQPWTTELTKAIGMTVAELPGMDDNRLSSPIVIDNWVRGWAGALGTHFVNLVDFALREAGKLPNPERPDDTLADTVFIKAFNVRYPSAGSKSIQTFYESYFKQKKVWDTIKQLENRGEIGAAIDMRKIHQSSKTDVDGIKLALAKNAKFARRLWSLPGLSPEEKRQFIDLSYFRMIEAAKIGNDMFERTEEREFERTERLEAAEQRQGGAIQ